MILLVQGVFFQNTAWLRANIGAVDIVHGTAGSMFSGMLYTDSLGLSWEGGMIDPFGQSRIFEVEYFGSRAPFVFKKQYLHGHKHIIRYTFESSEENITSSRILSGKWSAPFGEGTTRCIVTEVLDLFVQIPENLRNLHNHT